MIIRWKPEMRQSYWCVQYTGQPVCFQWMNTDFQQMQFEIGNVFKTQSEAESAAKMFKELLLRLRNNDENLQDTIQDMVTNTCQALDKGKENAAKATCTFGNLPKLTAEVFDYPDCPKNAKIAVVNQDGSACFGSFSGAEPVRGYWQGEGAGLWEILPGKWDASDWENSLIERPSKLPDWCNVDAIGWHKRCGYFKVTYIDDVSKRIDIQQVEDKSKGYLSFHTVCTEVMQARLRPFNANEMQGLVGKVLMHPRGNYLVTFFGNGLTKVKVAESLCGSDELLEHWTQLDGSPCGVLEHLEDGEWVE